MPPFLKIDFSEIPVLLGTFALGPLAGVVIELIKNLLHLTVSTTAGIGDLANFIVGCAYIIPAGLIYKRMKSRNGALIGLLTGVISMTLVASIANYYIFIPLYGIVLKFPVDAIIGMGNSVNGLIVSLKSLIAFGIAPFNIIKGIVISAVVLAIYKKVSPLLHSKYKQTVGSST
jgi:riboflavin transporter FmnP